MNQIFSRVNLGLQHLFLKQDSLLFALGITCILCSIYLPIIVMNSESLLLTVCLEDKLNVALIKQLLICFLELCFQLCLVE